MSIHVVVATKGRPMETGILLHFLSLQSRQADEVLIVGSSRDDLPLMTIEERGDHTSSIADRAGSSHQRNGGIRRILDSVSDTSKAIIVFFDDDYRPGREWLKECELAFATDPTIAGITGVVVADGMRSTPINEVEAATLLAAAERSTRGATNELPQTSLYGCNMAVRADHLLTRQFCEELPLYGLFEDMDLSGQLKSAGKLVCASRCIGIHLGVRKARTSEMRLGYSQIANPIWLQRRGTISLRKCMVMVLRKIGANCVKSLLPNEMSDYRGRLRGTVMALSDLLRGKIDPRRILDIPG